MISKGEKMKKPISIALCGTHGVGKSTLAQALFKELDNLYKVNVGFVDSVARDCPFPINEDTTVKSQHWIITERIKRELELNDKDIIICSRTVLDDFAYLLRFQKQMWRKLGAVLYQDAVDFERKIVEHWMHNYNYIFYMPVEFKIKSDDKRSDSAEFQRDIDKIILKELDGYNFSTVSGSVEERLKTILNAINTDVEKIKQEKISIKEKTLDYLVSLSK